MSGGPEAVRAILAALEDVADPEIPVVSVVDLGIVQSVEVEGDRAVVTITPTFSGCPALAQMRADIARRVAELGYARVEVPVVLDPPWTSDRITDRGREAMSRIGLAPPRRYRADVELMPLGSSPGLPGPESDDPVTCPFCGSGDTVLEGAFGPTICRRLHYCRSCRQPFESFKEL